MTTLAGHPPHKLRKFHFHVRFFSQCMVRPWLESLALVHLIPSWLVCAEIELTRHIALPKQPINQYKPVQESCQQVLRAYCPNIYILWL